MAKHTPGKWTLGDENNEHCEVILGTEHNLVCTLDRQDLNTSKFVISREEMLANARLIIAAPQMLEALKAFDAAAEDAECNEGLVAGSEIAEISYEIDANLFIKVLQQVRAVIKLAEGD